MQVYVLIYNPGTDNEGIYSLKIETQDVVLMFAEEDDAVRYAGLLEAQDFPAPVVEAIDDQDVEAFCQSAGLEAQLVPAGTLATPPEQNLMVTDWQAEVPGAEPGEYEPDELEALRRRLENLL
ncbi:MAG: DUF3110 domain-containing protein [Gloeomargaritaceae cyanobacterium C42_A2020_066]|nr:DUF3110 domain-containing protein [Gloeomargaritaceae cyanobacterium C42_A2020_066]